MLPGAAPNPNITHQKTHVISIAALRAHDCATLRVPEASGLEDYIYDTTCDKIWFANLRQLPGYRCRYRTPDRYQSVHGASSPPTRVRSTVMSDHALTRRSPQHAPSYRIKL